MSVDQLLKQSAVENALIWTDVFGEEASQNPEMVKAIIGFSNEVGGLRNTLIIWARTDARWPRNPVLISAFSGAVIPADDNPLSPAPAGDIGLGKVGTDPFNVTGLDNLLKALWIKNVYVGGFRTFGCVIETANKSAELNYKTTIIRTRTSSFNDAVHSRQAIAARVLPNVKVDDADVVMRILQDSPKTP